MDPNEDHTVCQYSAAHMWKGVVATTMLDCGPIGHVPACDKCAKFYDGLR